MAKIVSFAVIITRGGRAIFGREGNGRVEWTFRCVPLAGSAEAGWADERYAVGCFSGRISARCAMPRLAAGLARVASGVTLPRSAG